MAVTSELDRPPLPPVLASIKMLTPPPPPP
jgi:hypothetical protein